jgi:hypothetical protein
MFAAKPSSALRRMKLEELIAKLGQIEEQASLTLAEFPQTLTLERARLIRALAKQMRSHLQDQLNAGSREATDGRHLHSVKVGVVPSRGE